MDVLELAERLWQGEATVEEHNPLFPAQEMAEVADGIAFVASLANVSAFTTDDGLVLVDTGSPFMAGAIHGQLRTWPELPLHTAVYSHGHIDHVFGVPVFAEEAATNGWRAPHVIAHEDLPARFDRYVLTRGWNSAINQRQFSIPGLEWPTEWRYPHETYPDRHDVEVGGLRPQLHPPPRGAGGHTWARVPRPQVLWCGGLLLR